MNDDLLRRQRSIADRRPPAAMVAQCRRVDFGGDDDDEDEDDGPPAMAAASVAILERASAVPPVRTMAADGAGGDRSAHQRRHHRRDGCRPPNRVAAAANKYNSVSAGSALSKSMRYADGWLYERDAGGTVGHGGHKSRGTFLGREQFGTAAAAVVAAAAAAAAAAATAAAATAAAKATVPATAKAAAPAVPQDPYDRVRKNRMALPTTAAGQLDRERDRGASPRTPSPDYEDAAAASSRRSILECDVNPYDLIRQRSDDDDDDDVIVDDDDDDHSAAAPRRLSLKDKFVNTIQDAVFAKNRVAGGFGPFGRPSDGRSASKKMAAGTASGVNIAGHTVRLFDDKGPADVRKSAVSSAWYDDGSASDAAAATATEHQSPVRPPRRRCKPVAGGPSAAAAKRSHSLTAGVAPVVAEIRSILKKPASLTTDDLSPVRSRTPAAAEAAVAAARPASAGGPQKKTKKQVQFVIVAAAERPTTDGDDRNAPRQDDQSPPNNPAGADETIVAAVERKLKRSLSDRQNSGKPSSERPDGVTAFNDTMRIHVRHKNRPDSRAVFVERPPEPPPPPPPSIVHRGDDSNKTVVQVSPSGGGDAATTGPPPAVDDGPGQKTSILINSSPGLKTSVIIGEGGAAYAASSDNKVTISIGPRCERAAAAAAGRGDYRSNVTVVDRTGSRMSDFIRMNYDPVRAARLDVTPHVCGRRSAGDTPLVSPYRVSEIEKHRRGGGGRRPSAASDTESSSESCYASAKEDASYSSASYSSASFSSSCSCSSAAAAAAAANLDAEPIYEEISESPTPPPLPSCPPPERADHEPAAIPSRSIFEGATKYDIINYLVDAKRRCGALTQDGSPRFAAAAAAATDGHAADGPLADGRAADGPLADACGNNDSGGEEYGAAAASRQQWRSADAKKAAADIERNDSGVGSETSQSSRSKWQQQQQQRDAQHGCEDCDQPVEIQTTDGGIVFAPLVCRKCHKRRAERREIIAEIVETEEKYGRDLDIIAEEFYRPMMVAGLLNADQLTSVFLNVSELKEHSAALSQKLRDAYEIAVEQGDDDLLTVNIGRLFLDASPSMLHAFQSYCTRQGNAALLLANLEKEKELLRIFLRVSQMENAVLRRMNLNSFLMVPVQRVTKYPLLLARLYKVTPEHHLEARQTLNEARHKIQLHLEHINSLAKDISSTKLWRKIYAINGKRPDNEDLADIKFRKVAVDVLEWSGLGEEIRFAAEGRLLYTQPSDHNWRRGGRTIKLMPINAIVVTLGKPNDGYNPEADDSAFPRQNGVRDASLVLLKEKGGRISLLREPMYLDRCVVCCEGDGDDYFELHEITTKDTYILKGQDAEQTRMWYRQLQYHCRTLGCWRKRRNALANIMINKNCT